MEIKMADQTFKEPEVQYITRNGKRTGVILTLGQYEALLQLIEDLRDIQSAELRKKEPTIEYKNYRRKRLGRRNVKG